MYALPPQTMVAQDHGYQIFIFKAVKNGYDGKILNHALYWVVRNPA